MKKVIQRAALFNAKLSTIFAATYATAVLWGVDKHEAAYIGATAVTFGISAVVLIVIQLGD